MENLRAVQHVRALKPISPINSQLYVITPVINPQRFLSRYRLYREFEQRVLDAGAKLITVEVSFGNRVPEIHSNDDVTYVKLQTTTELWHKESMINIGMQHLPLDWEYVAWIDGDIGFVRPDWVQETLHKLQHYAIVQMFSHARDLDPKFTSLHEHRSFMWCYFNNISAKNGYQAWHPGFAWAARRKAINDLGRLIDWAILGAADRHMACALIGRLEDSFPPELKISCKRYYDKLLLWQERALKYINKNIGFVDGLIFHYWHGKKADRKYLDRWKILIDTEYDPDLDLKHDYQGLWQLTDNSIELRDKLRNYFAARNEDSIDID